VLVPKGLDMHLEIFDVEHGACALLTTSANRRILIDCGDSTATGWEPGTALLRRGITEIERLIITNYDEDHASGFNNLLKSVVIRGLQRNGNVTASHIACLKSEDGIGSGVRLLAGSFGYFNGPGLPTTVDDVLISAFCNSYGMPPYGFDGENNLSLVVFLSCGVHRIIFPGDMERAGWLALLRNRFFANMLSGVTIFVCSHHGRTNGFCEEVLKLCPNIQVFIISDKKKGFQSQETVNWYRPYARGFEYNGNQRHVLTTRRDRNMQFTIPTIGRAEVLLGLAA
jgi:beta-lactamase superfamily II metal-dependent hydrolase